MTTTTYVRYLLPGVFFPEETVEAVADRDPKTAAKNAPASAFAFTFHDQVTTEVDGVTLRSDVLNVSGRYYINAEKMTLEDVAELPGDNRILMANMRGNGWNPILRCRTGNFQPLGPDDVIITLPQITEKAIG